VLLPSDAQRKPITYVTVVLLPFVTYLLTLPLNIISTWWSDRFGCSGKNGVCISHLPVRATCPALLIFLHFITLVKSDEG
jgi:hypothetical protein